MHIRGHQSDRAGHGIPLASCQPRPAHPVNDLRLHSQVCNRAGRCATLRRAGGQAGRQVRTSEAAPRWPGPGGGAPAVCSPAGARQPAIAGLPDIQPLASFTGRANAVSLQCGHQTTGEPIDMDMEGIHAADAAHSVTGQGADQPYPAHPQRY